MNNKSKEGENIPAKSNSVIAKRYFNVLSQIKEEMGKVVIGQDDVVELLLRALLCDGHVLLEGVPGIAKTLIIRALGEASGCSTKRIQFTIDLLPTDILGLTSYSKEKGFEFIKGPIFANFVIADEINRAPPKTQSALLEAMQERQATIGTKTYPLPSPFFVMANQNPIETAGVNPLPEAQVDRFLFKGYVGYPKTDEEQKIMKDNITLKKFEDFKLVPRTNSKEIIKMQDFIKKMYMSKDIERYIVKITRITREKLKEFPLLRYVEYGASPRAAIGMFIGSKAEALLQGSSYVTPQHVKKIAHDVLRHRIILNYEGQSENIKTDDIITEILSKVAVP